MKLVNLYGIRVMGSTGIILWWALTMTGMDGTAYGNKKAIKPHRGFCAKISDKNNYVNNRVYSRFLFF